VSSRKSTHGTQTRNLQTRFENQVDGSFFSEFADPGHPQADCGKTEIAGVSHEIGERPTECRDLRDRKIGYVVHVRFINDFLIVENRNLLRIAVLCRTDFARGKIPYAGVFWARSVEMNEVRHFQQLPGKKKRTVS
jgi:hypothetical protein